MSYKNTVAFHKPVEERSFEGQLAIFLIGDGAFPGEVINVDPDSGQITRAYVHNKGYKRYPVGDPPTCGLLRDWTDKAAVFSACPQIGWNNLHDASEKLKPLYLKFKESEEINHMSEHIIPSEWQLNIGKLRPKMIIRLPGDTTELGQVYKVSGDQATYKQSGTGQNVVIPAASEVEYRWPKTEATGSKTSATPSATKPRNRKRVAKHEAGEPISTPDQLPIPTSEEAEEEEAVEPVVESTEEEVIATEDPQEEPENKMPSRSEKELTFYSVETIAEKTGRTIGNVNNLRKDGTIDLSLYEQRGRAYLYHPDVITFLDSLPKPTRGRKPGSQSSSSATTSRSQSSTSTATRPNGLLTLPQIAEQTGISYPTLVRYAKLHADRLPSEGAGRNRAFYPESVKVFETIRAEAKGGPKDNRQASKTGRKSLAVTEKTPSSSFTAPPKRFINQLESSTDTIIDPAISSAIDSLLDSIEARLTALAQEREKLTQLRDSLIKT